MSKSKPLSRNKTIKILHESTGKTYKECRAALKAYNWSLEDALFIAPLQSIPEIIERVNVYISAIAEAASAGINAFNNRLSEALSND